MIVAVALLWHQVFAMTGLLWWDAARPAQPVPRPAPPEIQAEPTGWVDLEIYLRNHPVWQP